MTTLKITLDAKTPALTNGGKQVPFALKNAIAASLKTAQAKQLAKMGHDFTLRRPQFAKLSVKITKFPTKTSLVGIIAIDPPGERDDIFGKFEKGGIKRPTHGRTRLAIPIPGTPARRTERSITPAALRPRALDDNGRFRIFFRTIKGKGLGLFAVDREKELAFLGKLRATPHGAKSPKMPKAAQPKLFYFLPTQVPIKPELHFVETVTTSVRETIQTDFEREFAHALATSRK